ncbi:ribonuclease H-like domain-containing protein [Tanacetum coccineum]
MWMFWHKYNANSSLSRYKDRLMENSSTQQLGIDCDDTFSLVVKTTTILTVMSLALSQNWPIHQIDVKNAFLKGDLFETIYLYQPSGFVDIHFPHHVCRLQRLVSHQVDVTRPCSYIDEGLLIIFLGISITRDSKGMFLSQKKYALELLCRAYMATCNPTRTLVDTESKLGSDGIFRCAFICMILKSLTFEALERVLRYVRVEETAWLHNLLCEYHTPLLSTTIIYYDNVSAIYLTANPVQHQRTKHIEIDIHFVRDTVNKGQVHDIFTKGLPSALFKEFRTRLSVRSSPAQTAREC